MTTEEMTGRMRRVGELLERDRSIGRQLDAVDPRDDRARGLLRERRWVREELESIRRGEPLRDSLAAAMGRDDAENPVGPVADSFPFVF
jgi:hypothetical protein